MEAEIADLITFFHYNKHLFYKDRCVNVNLSRNNLKHLVCLNAFRCYMVYVIDGNIVIYDVDNMKSYCLEGDVYEIR